MFIELVDSLRCPAAHEPGQLIAVATRVVARHILDGELGCPVCHARYAIEDGVTWFDPKAPPASSVMPDEDEAMRLAALLDLTEPGGFAVLTGAAAASAVTMHRVAADVHLLLMNPPVNVEPAPGLTIAMTGSVLPIADSTARGAAVGTGAVDELLSELVRVVRPGGRIVAPASLPMPGMLSRIAADDRNWVARREIVGDLVALRRK